MTFGHRRAAVADQHFQAGKLSLAASDFMRESERGNPGASLSGSRGFQAWKLWDPLRCGATRMTLWFPVWSVLRRESRRRIRRGQRRTFTLETWRTARSSAWRL